MIKVRYLAELRSLRRDGYLALPVAAYVEGWLRRCLAECRREGGGHNWRVDGYAIILEAKDDLQAAEFRPLHDCLPHGSPYDCCFEPALGAWVVLTTDRDAGAMCFVIPDATWLEPRLRAALAKWTRV